MPSPKPIDAVKRKPCHVRKSTLDSLPDVFRKARYALAEEGEIEIEGTTEVW